MESITSVMIGIGGLLTIADLLLGIIELGTIRTIRPPAKKTFAYIRSFDSRYKTILTPALGALISGLFVSLSASFFYESFAHPSDPSRQPAGALSFLGGVAALMITLRSIFTEAGEPSELTRDPFTIRAAAEEIATNPRRGILDPETLKNQLMDWEKYISVRSMNLSARATSDLLDSSLQQAIQECRPWTATVRSLRVYFAAFLRFPFRFGWPILGYLFLMTGVVWYEVDQSGFDFASSWRPWFAVAVFAVGGLLPPIFYCATRGNRARLWHRVHLNAAVEARTAIDIAATAHAEVAAEDSLLRTVLARANLLLDQVDRDSDERTILRFGKIRLSISMSPGRDRDIK